MPSDDFETTVMGTIRPQQVIQTEEQYDAGTRVRGVVYVGTAKILDSGLVDLDRSDLASAEVGGVSDILFRVEQSPGTLVLDLGLMPSGTVFEFVADTDGTYIFTFENTLSNGSALKAFSMGAFHCFS